MAKSLNSYPITLQVCDAHVKDSQLKALRRLLTVNMILFKCEWHFLIIKNKAGKRAGEKVKQMKNHQLKSH